MKLNREELEMRVLKHMTTSNQAMIRAKALNINLNHFGYIPEGATNSYTYNLAKIIFNYFDESDGSLLTLLVLENRLIEKGVKETHKGKFLTLWEDIQIQEYDPNELHDLLIQLKHKKAMEIWRDMHKEGHAIMVEEGLQPGVNYVLDCLKDIETELSHDPNEINTLDVTEASDFFVKEYKKQQAKPSGILGGYDELDKRTFGWRGGEVIVVLGSSGGGKSLQLLNWAYNAHKQNKNVLYFSFELTLWQCLIRHLSLAFKVPFNDLKRTSLEDDMLDGLVNNLKGIEDGPYFEYDFTTTDPTPEHIDMRIRELSNSKGKPDIVIVDYIGEMTIRNANANVKPWELHEKAFDGLCKIARRHNIPILTAQQVNRDTIRESRKTRDGGKIFNYDQSAASGGQHIIHQSSYVFIIEPDRETNLSVLYTIKSRDWWIPPYCVKVVPENSEIQELSSEEQEETRRLKGLSHIEHQPNDKNTSTSTTTSKDDDGNISVNMNDEVYNFSSEELVLEDLDIDSGWEFGS